MKDAKSRKLLGIFPILQYLNYLTHYSGIAYVIATKNKHLICVSMCVSECLGEWSVNLLVYEAILRGRESDVPSPVSLNGLLPGCCCFFSQDLF